jgi:hypothetical protein
VAARADWLVDVDVAAVDCAAAVLVEEVAAALVAAVLVVAAVVLADVDVDWLAGLVGAAPDEVVGVLLAPQAVSARPTSAAAPVRNCRRLTDRWTIVLRGCREVMTMLLPSHPCCIRTAEPGCPH